MLQEFFLLIVLLTISTVIELSMCIGVGGCGWPSSVSISLMILASFALRKSAPNSASAADEATNFNKVHKTWIAPFSLIGCSSLGKEPRMKYPAALRHPFGAELNEASEWTFNIISDL